MLTVTDGQNDRGEDHTKDVSATVNRRLTAAAEEIIAAFTKTINKYKEKMKHQHKLLEVILQPEIKLHRIGKLNPSLM